MARFERIVDLFGGLRYKRVCMLFKNPLINLSVLSWADSGTVVGH